LSRLIDPNAPPDLPLAAATPRWQKRHLGVIVAAVVAGVVAWSAWHYMHRVPDVPSNGMPVPSVGLR